jgi:hypothetical protein
VTHSYEWPLNPIGFRVFLDLGYNIGIGFRVQGLGFGVPVQWLQNPTGFKVLGLMVGSVVGPELRVKD